MPSPGHPGQRPPGHHLPRVALPQRGAHQGSGGLTRFVAGMEMGGIPIATVMPQLTGLPTVFVRKQAKEHGTGKSAEGGPVDGRRIVVIEDVVTTGGALLASCRQLRADGAKIDSVVCAIDREQGGRENLAVEALRLRAALTRRDLESSLPA
ncbi:orotate phosphoribosyltransferase [Micromonospora sp. NPDC020751]|uniref:orotate phosphoribosyltransferase n=1 Tax=Micromonospora sp. NPDC020751 TaxID=3364240 RepID=UPI0037BBC90D